MHPARIAELIEPFLPASSASDQRPAANDALYQHISTYIDILLRWNARINLTAIRDPEQIVTRHFGESLFAARHLFPITSPKASSEENYPVPPVSSVVKDFDPAVADVGSGAGFPGIPIKLWAPHISLTLIESNHKKATFLREIVRALTLANVNVFPGRAEQLLQGEPALPGGEEQVKPPQTADNPRSAIPTGRAFDLVTLRAVERYAGVLPVAARLVSPSGRLALLIGASQLDQAHDTLPTYSWEPPLPIPQSKSRILLIGHVASPNADY
jgi:16S rRNA (guanine527-N7)-methyltransferase